MTTQAQAVALTRRYLARLRGVTVPTASALERLWDDLDGWDEENVAEYKRRAAPLVSGAVRAATALTVAYLSTLLTAPPPPVDFAKFLEQIDLRSPFLAYWSALGTGQKWEEAITSGRTFSGTLASTAVQTAARGTSADVDEKEDRLTGWERVLVGPSCDYCATAATQRYNTAESAGGPSHDRCDCTVVPIIGKTAPGRVINRDLYDAMKSSDEHSAYVNPDGSPASRPDAAPVAAP